MLHLLFALCVLPGASAVEAGTAIAISSFHVPKSPSGMFYNPADELLWILCGTNTNGDHYLFGYTLSGVQKCAITIPAAVGMSRVDGFHIYGGMAYIADSQGPIYASEGGMCEQETTRICHAACTVELVRMRQHGRLLIFACGQASWVDPYTA